MIIAIGEEAGRGPSESDGELTVFTHVTVETMFDGTFEILYMHKPGGGQSI